MLRTPLGLDDPRQIETKPASGRRELVGSGGRKQGHGQIFPLAFLLRSGGSVARLRDRVDGEAAQGSGARGAAQEAAPGSKKGLSFEAKLRGSRGEGRWSTGRGCGGTVRWTRI